MIELPPQVEARDMQACGDAFATAQRYGHSRFACSRRPASLRLGLETACCAGLVSHPRSGPSGLFATAQRYYEKRSSV